MDYLTPGGSMVKLAPPHDFSNGQQVAFDLIPNIDDILNKVHSVGADGSYIMHNGSYVYQPRLNSYVFHNGGFSESEPMGNGMQYRNVPDPNSFLAQKQQPNWIQCKGANSIMNSYGTTGRQQMMPPMQQFYSMGQQGPVEPNGEGQWVRIG